MRVALQPCFVLHGRQYGDTSLIVELFTKDYGRVSLLAKGYRSQKKRSQNLQAFNELMVSWQGRGELKTLTAIESSIVPKQLVGVRLYSGLYVNELLMRLLQKADAHSELYQDYANLLYDIHSDKDIEISLRKFEFKLLAELGYALDCEMEADTDQKIQADQVYRYIADQGFFPAANYDQQKREMFVGEDLLNIAAGKFESLASKRAAKRLVRLALAPHLGDKPLKSRELFLSIQQ